MPLMVTFAVALLAPRPCAVAVTLTFVCGTVNFPVLAETLVLMAVARSQAMAVVVMVAMVQVAPSTADEPVPEMTPASFTAKPDAADVVRETRVMGTVA